MSNLFRLLTYKVHTKLAHVATIETFVLLMFTTSCHSWFSATVSSTYTNTKIYKYDMIHQTDIKCEGRGANCFMKTLKI